MAEEDFRIRLLQIADYDEVFLLWNRCAGMGMRSLDDSPEGIRKFLERNPRTCFTAESLPSAGGKRKIIGVILSGHDGRRAYIYHTAVDEAFRRGGIGRALVAAVEKAAHTEGINKIALVAFKSNGEGNRFWEKMGYTERQDLSYRNKSINRQNE
ncbi:MAG: GNAT family N-acetyltransferase [Treponema sp.]|jgi:ribosomal protein S18 acetylase RimI-like enzyme|nr:GNAT family N-acetyltransferase [Treponema sp.]